MVRHSTARQKFCSYKTEEPLQVEPQSNSNFYGSARRGTTYKTGLTYFEQFSNVHNNDKREKNIARSWPFCRFDSNNSEACGDVLVAQRSITFI